MVSMMNGRLVCWGQIDSYDQHDVDIRYINQEHESLCMTYPFLSLFWDLQCAQQQQQCKCCCPQQQQQQGDNQIEDKSKQQQECGKVIPPDAKPVDAKSTKSQTQPVTPEPSKNKVELPKPLSLPVLDMFLSGSCFLTTSKRRFLSVQRLKSFYCFKDIQVFFKKKKECHLWPFSHKFID